MRDPIETHDLESQPHIMLTMVPGFEGDEKLLRGEALAILEASWDKGHKIIPVLAFSFMARQQGRILQAYFNGEELISYKSEPYDFIRKEDAPINLFLQHLANILLVTRQPSRPLQMSQNRSDHIILPA